MFFQSFYSSLFVFQLSVGTDRGRGVVKQKADRRGQGREGLKTGKNVRTSFMDDPLIKIILDWILAILQQQQLYKFASFSIRLL